MIPVCHGEGVGVPGLQVFGRPGTISGVFVPGLQVFGRPGTPGYFADAQVDKRSASVK